MLSKFTKFISTALLLSIFATAHEALLVAPDGTSQSIRLVSATKDSITYQNDGNSPIELKLSKGQSIYLIEPQEFSAAMDLYEARKYNEAKPKFAAVKERGQAIRDLSDSYASLAAFYELECLRQSGDLEGLAAALQHFKHGPLTREHQLRQLELYVLWDAVRTKSWERLESLARERIHLRLSGDQRAQIAYCHGLALEGRLRPDEALLAYHTALTADAGASEVVARLAALRILAIHREDPAVRAALAAKPGQTQSTAARAALVEAAAVARLFESSLGSGTPLPNEFNEFLKFQQP
jgi:hypothetical protein